MEKTRVHQVFINAQIQRYLKRKRQHCFACQAERDAVTDIIESYWDEWSASFLNTGLSPEELCASCTRITIVFPGFVASNEQIIEVNFQEKTWRTIS